MASKAIFRGDLSSIFDLKRYVVCRKYSCADWANALVLRYAVLGVYFPKNDLTPRTLSDDNLKEELLEQLLISPMKLPEPRGPALVSRHKHRAIHDMSIYDLWNSKEYFAAMPDANAACERWGELMKQENWLNLDMPDLLDKSLHEHCTDKGVFPIQADEVFVSVKLAATDEKIVGDFKEWLAIKRNASSPQAPKLPKRFSQNHFDNWADKQILGFIDLTILSRYLGKRIPLHKIGELLYANDSNVDVAERVRKVTEPLSEWLMTSEVIDALQIQAAAEFDKQLDKPHPSK